MVERKLCYLFEMNFILKLKFSCRSLNFYGISSPTDEGVLLIKINMTREAGFVSKIWLEQAEEVSLEKMRTFAICQS